MVFQNFSIQGYKSIRDVTLPLAPLTPMIGANGSGKSNVIEGLRLLQWVAAGNRLTTLPQAVEKGGQAGGLELRQLPKLKLGESVGLGAAFLESTGNVLRLQMRLAADVDGWFVEYEELDSDWPKSGFPLYRLTDSSRGTYEVAVPYNNFAKGGKKPQISCLNRLAIFSQLTSPASFGANHRLAQEHVPRAARAVQRALESMVFLDPVPAHMRGYSFRSDKVLWSDGRNVSTVLHDLVEAGGRDAILQFVGGLPGDAPITDVNFDDGPDSRVQVKLEETFGGRKRPAGAAQLSDGTLRVLAIAAAALSAPVGAVLVVEEIDNGVHPSRASHLVDQLRATATRRGFQVLFTTHNPATLDGLADDVVPDLIVCRRGAEGDTRLDRLVDHPAYATIAALGPLGRAASRGRIERILAGGDTP